MASRFEFFREFHRISTLEEGGVDANRFASLTADLRDQETRHLFEYDPVVEEGGNYQLANPLSQFLAFVMGVQRPLQAAELERSLRAITQLLVELRNPVDGPELPEREAQLRALSNQTSAFEEDMIGHTLALTNELERLRDQDAVPTFTERAQTADRLMRQYVAPTANLLEANSELSARRLLRHSNGLTLSQNSNWNGYATAYYVNASTPLAKCCRCSDASAKKEPC